VLALARALRAVDGVDEAVPAARTLLVRSGRGVEWLRARLATVAIDPGAEAGGGTVELPVRYDGADLAAVAAEAGLDTDGLVRAHSGASYVVAFCGFAPGFAYLSGLPAALHGPRLAEPRTAVPAGAVGIAGEFTGVYPRQSPGGWRLLGRTDAVLWDADRDPPALLAPGTRVRFVPR
jgi:KipI family sensor histidine kinase inhibitor